MNDEEFYIIQIANHVKNIMPDKCPAHDWSHVFQVWLMAKKINEIEKGNDFIVEAAALLHDVADWKFHDGDEEIGPKTARQILEAYEVPEIATSQICEIISTMSFKGAGENIKMKTLEGEIVQDADRLDAMGARGIARTFAYSGRINRPIYDLNLTPEYHKTKGEYLKGGTSAINHFYEKLLLLKGRMNTQTGKKIAGARHAYMENFLEQFYAELAGEV